jgi:hypothetical protein
VAWPAIPVARATAAEATQAQTALALDMTPKAALTLPQADKMQFSAAEANWDEEEHSQASAS